MEKNLVNIGASVHIVNLKILFSIQRLDSKVPYSEVEDLQRETCWREIETVTHF